MYRDLGPMYWNRESNFFTVIFDSTGGSEVPELSLRKDSNIIKPQDPFMEGYVFLAWYTDPEYTVPWDFDNDTVIEDITLYAKWEIDLSPVLYTVIFYNNGGDTQADPESLTAERGGLIMPPLIEPARAGYGFYGWYKEPECINRWDFAADTVTGNITLYARWVQNAIIISISIEQIIDKAPLPYNITLSRTGSGGYETLASVVLENPGYYDTDSIRWQLIGVGSYTGVILEGFGPSYQLDANDIRYNTIGFHTLLLEVKFEGNIYHTNIMFEITN